MKKEKITASDFLREKGIEMETTALFTVIGGYVRQPSLETLLEEYAQMKIEELDIKISDFKDASEG